MYAIEVEKLTFGYRRSPILEDINIKVREKEIVSIIGPNGSGKTTLLRCIAGILKPWRGRVKILGRDLESMSQRDLNRIVSYLPQETVPPPSLMTVYEYVLLGRLHYISGKLTVSNEDHKSVFEILKLLELDNYAKKCMHELSGGEKQLVYIAQALVRKPKVLLLDEPLNHLDIKNQFIVLKVLRELVKKLELTVVIVMHDINQAARYSDKIVLMSSGKIVAEGPPDEVIVPELLEKVYGIKFRLIYDHNVPQVIPKG
ncbi:MAG: ABC transporter ATP-binding protein [Crenarchaeota archaeon]|nr:ABC transporter ATP-binding protein [Thermoproteota archaeon]